MVMHIPEPWEISIDNEFSDVFIRDKHHTEIIAKLYGYNRKENARRIVACVNACSGMGDPNCTIQSMLESLRKPVMSVSVKVSDHNEFSELIDSLVRNFDALPDEVKASLTALRNLK